MVAADAPTAITVALPPGQAHDAPEGQKLRRRVRRLPRPIHRLMDRAYEGDATQQLALDFGYVPVGVPPKHNRHAPWE